MCGEVGGMQYQRGACMAKGAYMVKGACVVKGGMHGWGAMHGRKDGHCSRRYASYWNVFLFFVFLS